VDANVVKAESKQRRSDKRKRQDEHRNAQFCKASWSEAGPRGHQSGINQPMTEKENRLDEEDGKNRPGFQTGSPSNHDCMNRQTTRMEFALLRMK
jgi:hypothetical protein